MDFHPLLTKQAKCCKIPLGELKQHCWQTDWRQWWGEDSGLGLGSDQSIKAQVSHSADKWLFPLCLTKGDSIINQSVIRLIRAPEHICYAQEHSGALVMCSSEFPSAPETTSCAPEGSGLGGVSPGAPVLQSTPEHSRLLWSKARFCWVTTLVQSWLYAHSIGDESFGPINYPLLLSRICTCWRQVAVTTPSLWLYLDFDIANYPSANLWYLNFCYERSASAPLSVRFGRYNHECNLEGINDQLALLLGSYAKRLELVAISYSRSKFVKETLAILFAEGATGQVCKLALHAILGDKQIIADDLLSQRQEKPPG